MATEIQKTDEQWREELTPEQYAVLRKAGTERAFTGKYWDNHEDGMFRCAGCGAELFSSDTKFESGSGWPSFTEPAVAENVETKRDLSHGMVRTEVVCKKCGGHLGHVFDDGPRDAGGLRYCINSARGVSAGRGHRLGVARQQAAPPGLAADALTQRGRGGLALEVIMDEGDAGRVTLGFEADLDLAEALGVGLLGPGAVEPPAELRAACGGSHASTSPQSHSLPSAPRSYQRPPARGSMIACVELGVDDAGDRAATSVSKRSVKTVERALGRCVHRRSHGAPLSPLRVHLSGLLSWGSRPPP